MHLTCLIGRSRCFTRSGAPPRRAAAPMTTITAPTMAQSCYSPGSSTPTQQKRFAGNACRHHLPAFLARPNGIAISPSTTRCLERPFPCLSDAWTPFATFGRMTPLHLDVARRRLDHQGESHSEAELWIMGE